MNELNDRELLLAFLNEELPADKQEELFARLRSESELVRRMLDLSADEEMLREWATGQERHFEGPPAAEDISMPVLQGEKKTSSQDSEALSPSARRRVGISNRLSLVAVAAMLLFAACFVWWWNLPTAIAHVEHASSTVGLSRGFGWRTVRIGESLRFDAGVVELTTTHGVKIVAEGPFDCRFDSAQRLTLLAGRLYADVPEAGHGFQVQTPDGEVVDWGTKFGVEVQPNQPTEVHVFEGRVTAELEGDKDNGRADLQAGRAVVLNAQEKTVHEIPLSHKFVQQAAPFVEHFTYGRGALAGNGVWFDSGQLPQQIYVDTGDNIDYPGISPGAGGSLSVGNPRFGSWSPVGCRWHDQYLSMLTYPDDDFAKRLTLEPATLISFGSLNGPVESPVQLVVRKSDKHDRQSANFGLAVDGVAKFLPESSFRGRVPCLIVMRLGDDQIDLWVNPPSDTLGRRQAPPPSISLPRKADDQLESLWINDAENPNFTWFFVDAIRGGSTWADVTPRS